MDLVEQLAELRRLHVDGALTDEEFAQAKRHVLGRLPAATPVTPRLLASPPQSDGEGDPERNKAGANAAESDEIRSGKALTSFGALTPTGRDIIRLLHQTDSPLTVSSLAARSGRPLVQIRNGADTLVGDGLVESVNGHRCQLTADGTAVAVDALTQPAEGPAYAQASTYAASPMAAPLVRRESGGPFWTNGGGQADGLFRSGSAQAKTAPRQTSATVFDRPVWDDWLFWIFVGLVAFKAVTTLAANGGVPSDSFSVVSGLIDGALNILFIFVVVVLPINAIRRAARRRAAKRPEIPRV